MSEDNRWALTPQERSRYRAVLVAHGNDGGPGSCPICNVVTCDDWRDAFDRLALAGELMAGRERWESRLNTVTGTPWT